MRKNRAFVILGCLAGLVPAAVHAANFLVDTTVVDAGDLNPGDGVCAWATFPPPNQRCTLRAAVQEANALPGHDVIVIPGGFEIVLDQIGAGEDAAISGDLDITESVAIGSLAAGDFRPVIDAAGIDRIFDVHSPAPATFVGLVLTGGDAGASNGGAIRGRPDTLIMVTSSRLVGNHASTGGALRLEPDTGGFPVVDRLVDVALVGNTADFTGSAISNIGFLEIEESEIAGNQSPFGGDGALTSDGGAVTVRNTTIAGNQKNGIAVSNTGLSLLNSTVVDNGNEGVQYFSATGLDSVVIKNTIIAHNTDSNPDGKADCQFNSAGVFDVAGNHNLDSDNSCGLSAAMGDLPATDPLLGPLQLNGGTTRTMVPALSGPVVDAGENSTCETDDQRGATRPLDGDKSGVATCDIGAVEVLPCLGDPELFVGFEIITGTEEFEGCLSIYAINFEVWAGGHATFRARDGVSIDPSFAILNGGTFEFIRDPAAGSGMTLP